MSTTPYPGPDEVIIPSRIYFDDGKRIDVKVWPKTIQLTGPTKDLNTRYSKPLRNMMIGGISLRKRILMLFVKMRNM